MLLLNISTIGPIFSAFNPSIFFSPAVTPSLIPAPSPSFPSYLFSVPKTSKALPAVNTLSINSWRAFVCSPLSSIFEISKSSGATFSPADSIIVAIVSGFISANPCAFLTTSPILNNPDKNPPFSSFGSLSSLLSFSSFDSFSLPTSESNPLNPISSFGPANSISFLLLSPIFNSESSFDTCSNDFICSEDFSDTFSFSILDKSEISIFLIFKVSNSFKFSKVINPLESSNGSDFSFVASVGLNPSISFSGLNSSKL